MQSRAPALSTTLSQSGSCHTAHASRWDDRHEEYCASSCPTAEDLTLGVLVPPMTLFAPEDGRQQSLGEHPSCPNTHFPWESKTASVVCFSLENLRSPKEKDILDRHMTPNGTKNSVIGPLVASHNSLGVMNQIPSFCHGQWPCSSCHNLPACGFFLSHLFFSITHFNSVTSSPQKGRLT